MGFPRNKNIMKKLLICLVCLIGFGLTSGFAHGPNHHVPSQPKHHVYVKPAPKIPHKHVIVIDKPMIKPRVYVAPVLPPPPPPVYIEPVIVVPEPQPIIEFRIRF